MAIFIGELKIDFARRKKIAGRYSAGKGKILLSLSEQTRCPFLKNSPRH
jgi:hypothetical protein